MAIGMGPTGYVVEGLASLIDAALAAAGWDLGIPRCNEDFVWH